MIINVKVLFTHMRNQYGDRETNLFALSRMLKDIGKLNDAEKYDHRLLSELLDKHE
jgi:hypothetical protein